MLHSGDKFQLRITGYGSDGEGVSKFGEYTVFAPFLLEGETAELLALHVKNGICYAAPEKVIKASKERAVPPCPYYGICGGCNLMHLSYGEQLRFKSLKVAANFRKIARLEIMPQTEPSHEQLRYRNKISLPVGGVKGDVAIGMYKRASHEIVPLESCLICGEWADLLVKTAKKFLDDVGAVPYDERTFQGDVRHVTGRYINGALAVTIVTNGAVRLNYSPFAKALSEVFVNYGLFENINNGKNNVILGKTTRYICGEKELTGEHFGAKYFVRPTSFFQVNDGVKNALYDAVIERLRAFCPDVVFECYSGVGLLSVALCRAGCPVYCVEIDQSSHTDAEKTKQVNNLVNMFNVLGDVKTVLPELTKKFVGKNSVVVVDPPRKGLEREVVETLLSLLPEAVIYISCDSATLARDASLLSSKYEINYVKCFDMFPETSNVETLCEFTRTCCPRQITTGEEK